MDIILAGESAYRYWMKSRRGPSAAIPVPYKYSLSVTREDIAAIAFDHGLTAPIDLLITQESNRRYDDGFTCHFERTGRVSCIVPIHEGFAVASPELCFLQLARSANLQELIFYGFRLCSSYRFNEFSPTGMETVEPLMTVSSARTLLTRLSHCHGSKAALTALGFIIENAASPKEIEAAMRLCLPYHLGGYKLPKLELNPEIPLSKAAQRALGRPSLKPDFFWREAKLLAEYQSDLTHLNPDQYNYDLKRMNVFASMGYKQIYIGSNHLSDYSAMDQLANDIAKLLGKRIRPSQADFFSRQAQLVRTIRRLNDERI